MIPGPRSYARQSNPAVHQMVDGYAKFHAALAVIGSLFLIVIIFLGIISWVKFKKVRKEQGHKWQFEKKTYFFFGSLLTVTALFLALIVVANISNAVKPLPGFSSSISSLEVSNSNTQLRQGFSDWVTSGDDTPPSVVSESIHDRRVFHGGRLLLGVLILTVTTLFSIRIWKKLVEQRNSNQTAWSIKEIGYLVLGVFVVIFALLMVLVIMANFQSFVVPIANTLIFG